MKKEKDSPRVYIPPPFLYAGIFFLSFLIQHYIPLTRDLFERSLSNYLAIAFFGMGIVCGLPALIKFIKTRNTVLTVKPAASLQTQGIYNLSRNPMYVGLLLLYIAFAFIKGNLWTFLLIPLLIFIITRFVIINEEKYLKRAFGQEYLNYMQKVRRWI